ncbi:MAG: hypothetical protein J2P17_21970, partial [Mycobacterium sp.]|nr:hypothetical protein [Mycobacterium sp.]
PSAARLTPNSAAAVSPVIRSSSVPRSAANGSRLVSALARNIRAFGRNSAALVLRDETYDLLA